MNIIKTWCCFTLIERVKKDIKISYEPYQLISKTLYDKVLLTSYEDSIKSSVAHKIQAWKNK